MSSSSSSSSRIASKAKPNEDLVLINSSDPFTAIDHSAHQATPSLLASLTAVPAALHAATQARGKRSKSKGGIPPVKHVGKDFNVAAGYPNMSRTVNPYNQVTIQSSIETQDFVTSSTTVPVYTSCYFALGSLANSSAFTGVFDQYKIDRLEVWIVPTANSVPIGAQQYGSYSSCIDYDDANTPPNASAVLDKQTVIQSSMLAGQYHSWKPRFAIAAYSGTFTSYSSSDGWVDCASPGVQYYGLKMALSISSGGAPVNFNLLQRFTVSFRMAGI